MAHYRDDRPLHRALLRLLYNTGKPLRTYELAELVRSNYPDLADVVSWLGALIRRQLFLLEYGGYVGATMRNAPRGCGYFWSITAQGKHRLDDLDRELGPYRPPLDQPHERPEAPQGGE